MLSSDLEVKENSQRKITKRNKLKRTTDGLHAFFATLWSFKNFRRFVYIGGSVATILFLEIYHPTILPTIVYSVIGMSLEVSNEFHNILKPDALLFIALTVVIVLLWRIAYLLE